MGVSRHSPRRPTSSRGRPSQAAVPVSPATAARVLSDAADTRRAATDDHASRHPSTLSSSAAATTSHRREVAANDSGFSRHDSLFSFGVSSSRNAAELKSLLGNSHSRLKPGATVLSVNDSVLDKHERRKHAVSLEQAKTRARVEVDIVLESDCFIEGGYMRGSIKLRVRKRQKKEAHVLLAEGKVRVIGFECIPGERDHHTFYQRASPLSAITDAYTGVYDSPPDSEGFSRAMEGVHVLPFAMHLPIDDSCGSAKGAATIQSGVTIRYIAMISVKVKDSKTGKRSIAHFYRDCEVWPRMNPSVVLANAPRPIQASTAKSLSVIGGGNKLKLTATLHRMTWIAGQRCCVRIWITNETKKTIKSVTLTLVRTTTLFKPKPQLDPGNRMSIDPDACQTATTHKVVAEELLERSHSVAKGHASAQGWWTGVSPGQEAQFSHWILIPPEALSIPRSRLVEVEYTIRVTVSAGALTPDVHVTLPVRIINFLSVDPTPSEPLLSRDGAYTRLIPYEQLQAHDSLSRCDSSSLLNVPSTITQGGRYSDVPSLATAKYPAAVPSTSPDDVPSSKSRARRIPLNTPLCMSSTRRDSDQEGFQSTESISDDGDAEELDGDLSMSSTGTSESDSSMFSAASSVDSVSSSAGGGQEHDLVDPPTRILGNLELDDDADSDEEVDLIVGTAQLDSRSFPQVDSNTGLAHLNPRGRDSDLCVEEASSRDAAGDDNEADAAAGKSLAMLRQSARRRREEQGPLWRRSDMRYDLPASVRGPRHIREAAASRTDVDILTHDEVDVVEYAQGEDEDEGDTPRLGSSACPSTLSVSSRIESIADAVLSASPPISASSSISSSTSGSQQRPSRQLPQPPSRHGSGPSQLSDIPTSVSALEAIRLSRLSGSSGPGSTLSRSSACHSLPTTQARTLDDSGNAEHSHSARWRPAYERSETVPPSLSATAVRMTLRPTHALRKMGESECSVVKGRIAAFEERLKHSRDTGAAYA